MHGGGLALVFSSVSFLFFFLTVVIALYFIVPGRFRGGRNFVLLAASLFFYACAGLRALPLLLFSVLLDWGAGLLLPRVRRRKALLAAAVTLHLALLFWFKYAGFAAGVFGIPLPEITLPIGISFFTFQGLSYVVDVSRGDVKAQRNFIDLAAYVAMFPQLIAGPIVRYSDIASQLEHRTHSLADVAAGARRFVLGLGKKVLLANVFYELITTFKASGDRSVLFYWLYAAACVLNIYFDFSGYSDMAIGLGRIFGFRYLENFDYPYISASITEFWRRWHMSLGSWFRDYVYIPLGGNRVSKTKWLRNILVVWLLTGLWHGAAWNFVLWGLFFAVFLTAEKLWYGRALAKTRVFKHIYVLLLVIVSFVLFDANSVGEAAAAIGGLFGAAGVSAVNPISLYYLRSFAVVFLIGIVGATPLPKRIVEQLGSTRAGAMVVDVLEPLVLVSVLAVSTGYLVDGSFNPFLYFRF